MGRERDGGGVIAGVRFDLQRLHETWMALIFPRQRDAAHSVLGKWRPTTSSGLLVYRAWAAVGVPVIAFLYPLALAGFATRYYAHRIDRTAASLGILGVVLVSLLVWGALTLVAWLRNFPLDGFIAVVAASLVATLAAVLAVVFTAVDGRATTVLLGYPFGVTALFLPPVVAALYSPTLADVVFPKSTTLAKWLLDNVLVVGGLNEYLRSEYDLEGLAYVGMWFGIAVPVGWFLGLLVTLADVVRPR